MSKVARKGSAKGKKAEPAKKRPASPPAPEEAIADFAAAVNTFQKNDFRKAAGQLEEIIQGYPDEREICHRARVYLAACRRHIDDASPRLESPEDHYNWGIILLNRGDAEEAGRSFEASLSMAPADHRARYALACAQARQGLADQAVASLREAIGGNPGNRLLARSDPDMESLRAHPGFQDLMRGSGGGES